VICDEALSALDLSVQAQVINLLRELQTDFDVSYLFIGHDLAVVRHLSDRMVVLYRGRVMEQGSADAIYDHPAHPYTRALRAAAPLPDPELQRQRREARPTTSSETEAGPAGESCPFAHRCVHVIDLCRSARPRLEQTPNGSLVACHRWRDLSPDAHQSAAATAQSPSGEGFCTSVTARDSSDQMTTESVPMSSTLPGEPARWHS
jgi:oligopeptide/dipeptide ABC transporter ATP-binding protein